MELTAVNISLMQEKKKDENVITRTVPKKEY
jgi:hypothetical protein